METAEVKDSMYNQIKSSWHKLHSLGFWIIIFVMIGFYFGVTWSKTSFENKFDETVKIKGMLYKGKIYEVTERTP